MLYEIALFWFSIFLFLLGIAHSWQEDWQVHRDSIMGGVIFFGLLNTFGMYASTTLFGFISVITGWIVEFTRGLLYVFTVSGPADVLVAWGVDEYAFYFAAQLVVFALTYVISALAWLAGYISVPVLSGRIPVRWPVRIPLLQPRVIPAEKGVILARSVDGDWVIRRIAYLEARLQKLERGDGRRDGKPGRRVLVKPVVKFEVVKSEN